MSDTETDSDAIVKEMLYKAANETKVPIFAAGCAQMLHAALMPLGNVSKAWCEGVWHLGGKCFNSPFESDGYDLKTLRRTPVQVPELDDDAWLDKVNQTLTNFASTQEFGALLVCMDLLERTRAEALIGPLAAQIFIMLRRSADPLALLCMTHWVMPCKAMSFLSEQLAIN